MINYAERIAKGTAIVFLISVVGLFIGYLFRMFLARNLTLEDFGLFYAILAFIGLTTLFRDLGLNQALVKHIPEFLVKRNFGKIKSSIILVAFIQLIIASLFILVLFVFSDQIAVNYFHTISASLYLSEQMVQISESEIL